MALDFNASGRFVNHGSAASLDNIPTTYGALTAWAWVYRSATGGNQHIISKDGAFPSGWSLVCDTFSAIEGQLRFIIFRGSTDTNWTDFVTTASVIPADTWTFVAAVHDENGSGSTRATLYVGSITEPVAPVTSYARAQGGAGSTSSDASYNLYAGNLPRATTLPFKGRIARAGVHGALLTLDDLRRIQYASIEACAMRTPLLTTEYLLGDSTQRDVSGQGNHGTVTSATVAANPPILWRPARLPTWYRVGQAAASTVTLDGATATTAWVVPAGTATATAGLSGSAATAAWTVPAGTVSATADLSGSTATTAWTVPAGTFACTATLDGATATATWAAAAGDLSVEGSATLDGASAAAAWTVPAGTFACVTTLTGSTATAAWTVAAGALDVAGVVGLAGTSATAAWTVPAGALVCVVGLTGTSASATWQAAAGSLTAVGAFSYTVIRVGAVRVSQTGVSAVRVSQAGASALRSGASGVSDVRTAYD